MPYRIWIVNYYTDIPEKASNPRYLQLAKHFMQKGWDVITFNANYSGLETAPLFIRKQYGDYDFVHVKAPHYDGNGLKRIWSILVFAWRIFWHRRNFETPDVILQNIHPPFDYPVVWTAKRLKAKYIAEEWDSWPEDFVASGLVSASNPLMLFAYHIEKLYYYNANAVISTLQGTKDHIIQKGWSKERGGKFELENFYYINNGVDLEQFDQDKKEHPRKDSDINDNGIIKVVYVGSINGANQVLTLIEAAALLKNNPKYKFFIYGDGYLRPKLEEFVRTNYLDNVVFKERRVSFSEVPWIVSQATVNVMNYEKGFGRWGVSSGKMFMYLAAGKPIICNVDIKYDNVIKDNHLGICKDIETPQDFADSIKLLAEQAEDNYNSMCERVRKCASRFDYKVLAEKEISVVESLFRK